MKHIDALFEIPGKESKSVKATSTKNESWCEKHKIVNVHGPTFLLPQETKDHLRVLSSSGNRSNVMLFGKSGTGKTTIIEYLSRQVPEQCSSVALFSSTAILLNPDIVYDGLAQEYLQGSTILIDDFDLIPQDFQVKILNLIEENSVRYSGNKADKHKRFIISLNDHSSNSIIPKISDYFVVLELPMLDRTQIGQRLQAICKVEKITIDNKALEYIIFVADRNLKTSITMLQTCYFYNLSTEQNTSDKGVPRKITIKTVLAICKVSDIAKITKLVKAISTGSVPACLQVLDDLLIYADIDGLVIINTMIQLLQQDSVHSGVISYENPSKIDPALMRLNIFHEICKYRDSVGNNSNSLIQLTNLLCKLCKLFQ